MEGENKHTQTQCFCCCGLAVELQSAAEAVGFILFHRQEERNPREETSVKQGKEALQS